MTDLSNHLERKKIVMQMHSDIDAACIKHFEEGFRNHLGGSVIGDPCSRKIWSGFRWLAKQKISGQGYRLFNRGHLEEPRFIKWMELIGFQVTDIDPATGKQYRITGSKGHYGGSLDGIAWAPIRYNIEGPLLTEFKTHNEKNFNKLKLEGVAKSKPVHFKQMCTYGRTYGIKYGLYMAVNKNTDELHIELVVLDWSLGDDLGRKADSIIFSQVPPPKIAQVETFFDCKYCDFAGICHRGEPPIKNCRSCVHAVPIDDGQWGCMVHKQIIPTEIIKVGCDKYTRIV